MSVAVHLPEYTRTARRRFVGDVASIVGAANIRGFYLPAPSEGLVVPDAFVAGRSWTHGNTPAGRVKRLGKLAALDFNGTSDYLSTPDAADLSFNGVTDAPMSAFAVANITDTANSRTFITKWVAANTTREWAWQVGTTDLAAFQVRDESVATSPTRTTDAAVAQGSLASYGFSYTGAGGATAMAGVTHYQNGAVAASTAAEQATYVAMEDTAAVVEIGAINAHTTAFFQGSLALVLLVAANLSATQHAALNQRCREYGLVA